jgi:phage protein D
VPCLRHVEQPRKPGTSFLGLWERSKRFTFESMAKPSKKNADALDDVSLAREHTETAAAALVDIIENSPNAAARVAAARTLLERGHGTAGKRETREDNEEARKHRTLAFDETWCATSAARLSMRRSSTGCALSSTARLRNRFPSRRSSS